MGTGGSFSGIRAAETWSWTIPPYFLMVWYLVKHRDFSFFVSCLFY
jgi:hypothetical protein